MDHVWCWKWHVLLINVCVWHIFKNTYLKYARSMPNACPFCRLPHKIHLDRCSIVDGGSSPKVEVSLVVGYLWLCSSCMAGMYTFTCLLLPQHACTFIIPNTKFLELLRYNYCSSSKFLNIYWFSAGWYGWHFCSATATTNFLKKLICTCQQLLHWSSVL